MAQAVREAAQHLVKHMEAAQHLVKQSQQLHDTSDRLIREAEALLFERQRALREVMSRRTDQSLRNRPS